MLSREAEPVVPRLPVVGVMGAGNETHAEISEPLGRWLATQSVHLLTGGGEGVMRSVSRAFFESSARTGKVIGILPGSETGRIETSTGYPNPWVEIPIYTHLPLSGARGTDTRSRNHINVLSADVVIALPGRSGTRSEIELAGRYGRPLIAIGWRLEELPAGAVAVHSLDELRGAVLDALGELGHVRP